MKNWYVPYDIAKSLRDLGFDESCLGTYLTDKSVMEGKLYPAEQDCDNTPEFDEDGYKNFVVIKNSDLKNVPQYLAAPLYQQVDEWLETKHGILINIISMTSGCTHRIMIDKYTAMKQFDPAEFFERKYSATRKEALEKAIEDSITILKR